MTGSEIQALFQRFARLKVGVIGDFALDLYVDLQTETGERSLETNRAVFWGSHPRASLGAAGNVVQNLITLGITSVHAIGCVGNDLFGREMQHLFTSQGVNTAHLHRVPTGWDTCVYTKPNHAGAEANRIDFGTNNKLSDTSFAQLMAGLEHLLNDLDVLVINQQFTHSLLSKKRVSQLNQLIAYFPNVRCVADMRDISTHVRSSTLKMNTSELAKFLHCDYPDQPDLDWCIRQGNAFRQRSRNALLITRGQAGILYIDQHGAQAVDGLSLPGPLDTVGAGDTVVATWAACLGTGATPMQALKLANLAAAVTVQKLAQTGTASVSEIIQLHHQYFPS